MASASQRLRVSPEMKLLAFKLIASLAIDAIGASSFVLPAFGELFDVGWAPVSAALVWYLYGDRRFVALNFVEEILPFTDWIPSATLAWLSEVYLRYANMPTAGTTRRNSDESAPTTSAPSSAPSWSQSYNVMGFTVHWMWAVIALLLLVVIVSPYRA